MSTACNRYIRMIISKMDTVTDSRLSKLFGNVRGFFLLFKIKYLCLWLRLFYTSNSIQKYINDKQVNYKDITKKKRRHNIPVEFIINHWTLKKTNVHLKCITSLSVQKMHFPRIICRYIFHLCTSQREWTGR